MTETTPLLLEPTDVAPRPDPTIAVRRALTIGLAVAGPVLLLVGGVAGPDLSGSNVEVMAQLPAVSGQLLTAHLLNTAGSFAYIATILLTWSIPVPKGAVLRLIGGAVAVVALLGNAMGETLDGYAAWAGERAGLPSGQLARLFDVLDASPAALPVSWLAIPLLGVGGVVLWIGVIRAYRVVPMWAPMVAVAGTLAGLAIGGAGAVQLIGIVGAAGAVATALYAARTSRP
jgi:hypothetical protein